MRVEWCSINKVSAHYAVLKHNDCLMLRGGNIIIYVLTVVAVLHINEALRQAAAVPAEAFMFGDVLAVVHGVLHEGVLVTQHARLPLLANLNL